MMRLQPWHVAFAWAVGWASREQQRAIEYLSAENRVLREQVGKKRILLTDDQRRRLAVKGKDLGRKGLSSITTLLSTQADGPSIDLKSAVSIDRTVCERESDLGYRRIQGALKNVGQDGSESTVSRVLRWNGLEPAPIRKTRTRWREFLPAHWDKLASVDFTCVEIWTPRGLTTYYLLFVIELRSRRVYFAGFTACPNDGWMQQIARNLIDDEDGFLKGSRLLLMDRDTKFSSTFRQMIRNGGVRALRLPPKTPNLNAHVERFMRSIKEECLNQMVFFGEKALPMRSMNISSTTTDVPA